VAGDVRYQRIEIHLGAQVTGRLIHEERTEAGNIVDLKAHNQNG
jgi:cytoskeletal protein CcmA (bactofilin family)